MNLSRAATDRSTPHRSWQRGRRAGLRWAALGVTIGAAAGVIGWAPASWLAAAVDQASNGHVLLAEASGTVWDGEAVLVLAGGAGSRDAAALPGRLGWTLRPAVGGFTLQARHACCLDEALALRLRLGWSESSLQFEPSRAAAATAAPAAAIGHWPAAWLAGLGTPWNTLALGGTLRLSSPGWQLHWSDTRLQAQGELRLDIDELSSRVSPLPALGSYQLELRGAGNGNEALVNLATRDGALLLSGQGRLDASGLRFRGEARAAEGQESVLSNLLNIIGRRQGALSVISIG